MSDPFRALEFILIEDFTVKNICNFIREHADFFLHMTEPLQYTYLLEAKTFIVNHDERNAYLKKLHDERASQDYISWIQDNFKPAKDFKQEFKTIRDQLITFFKNRCKYPNPFIDTEILNHFLDKARGDRNRHHKFPKSISGIVSDNFPGIDYGWTLGIFLDPTNDPLKPTINQRSGTKSFETCLVLDIIQRIDTNEWEKIGICENCDEIYKRHSKSGKFCSDKCRMQHFRRNA